MAATANAPRDMPSSILGKDFNLVRSPDYNSISPHPEALPKSAVHLSPRSRSELADRYRQQHHNQIRPMKSALYVPAVLRPTEKPVRHSPPQDTHDEAHPGDESWGAIVGSEEIQANGLPSSSQSSARTGVSRVTADELNDTHKGPVTGLPSTNHWKPDSAAAVCNARHCSSQFGFFVRRHHCRRCGNIFCWQHSGNQAPLDQHALFHAGGTLSRVCDRCHRCYNEWELRRSSRSNSESSTSSPPMHIRASSVSSAPGPLPARDLDDAVAGPPADQAAQEPFRPKSFVASIPNHWNWSTF